MHAHRFALPVLLCAMLMAPPSVSAAAKPGLLVQRFDFYDTSIDQRPMVIADQNRWLHDATALLRRQIGADGQVVVISGAAQHRLLAGIAQNYEHPSTCRPCALAAAHTLGARYLVMGSIHKISDLICYMRGELDDVRTGKVLLVTSTEVKADNKTMWLRAAHAVAVKINRKLQGENT
jgi:hypothetical protein